MSLLIGCSWWGWQHKSVLAMQKVHYQMEMAHQDGTHTKANSWGYLLKCFPWKSFAWTEENSCLYATVIAIKMIWEDLGPFPESKERKIDFLYHLSRTNRTRFKIVFQLDLHSVLASFKRKEYSLHSECIFIAYIKNNRCQYEKVGRLGRLALKVWMGRQLITVSTPSPPSNGGK